MMDAFGGFSVRMILRAILALVLLLGGGVGDRVLAAAPDHGSCCCGTPAGGEDSCLCPKPDTNRAPSPGACADRRTEVALQAELDRAEQGLRRTEPRPESVTRAHATVLPEIQAAGPVIRGRDPDLGRHLARLSTFRI